MRNVIDFDLQYNGNGELEILEDAHNPANYHDYSDASSGWRLDVTVTINNEGNLEVYDTTPYEQWDLDGYQGDDPNDDEEPRWKFIILERVISNDLDNPKTETWIVKDKIVNISDLRHSWTTELIHDGLYHYQKLIIPYEENVSSSLERLYYKNEKIYHVDSDNNTIVEFSIDEESFDELYDLVVDNQFNNCYYFSCDTFCLINLIKCYVLKEKARISDYLKNNCGKECNFVDSRRDLEVDILLAAIMVIEDLVNHGYFFEAQQVLNGFNTCGGLCKDVRNNLKGCGCGKN